MLIYFIVIRKYLRKWLKFYWKKENYNKNNFSLYKIIIKELFFYLFKILYFVFMFLKWQIKIENEERSYIKIF